MNITETKACLVCFDGPLIFPFLDNPYPDPQYYLDTNLVQVEDRDFVVEKLSELLSSTSDAQQGLLFKFTSVQCEQSTFLKG